MATALPTLSPREGYDRWAPAYDSYDNPVVALDGPVVERLQGDVRGRRVVDIGCGTGRHALRLLGAGAEVTGVDFSVGMLGALRAKHPPSSLRLVEHDLTQGIPLPDGAFDLVLCCLVMEHLPDLGQMVAEMGRIGRSGARIVVTDLHPQWTQRGLHARFREGGDKLQIAGQEHRICDYVMAGVRAGLRLERMEEHGVDDALAELAARYARSHGPFEAEQFATRYGLGRSTAAAVLGPLVASGKLLSGSFTPGRTGEELCDPEVLRTIKRRSLARLRREVEPVPEAALGRFLGSWHELDRPRSGIDATLSVIEQLEGLALPASVWLEDVLPRRVRDFRASDLDDLCSAGEILWRGVEPIGAGDGRVAFHLAERYALLAAPTTEPAHPRAADILAVLERRGAVFFSDLVTQVGGFANDILEALWDLVFAGLVTNDTTTPLRSYFKLGAHRERSGGRPRLRTRRALPPGSEGRWSLLPKATAAGVSDTDRRTALANVLLERYGVVTREVVQAENVAGGFGAVYPILKAMEEAGRVRRGYFIEGLGAAQFARAGVDERLRALRDPSTEANGVVLAATDPANPYGAALPWPAGEPRPQRAAGAHVVLVDGALGAFIGRGDENMALFLPRDEPERSRVATAVAVALSRELDRGTKRAITIAKIDGVDAGSSPVAATWKLSGFVVSGSGLLVRRV